MSLKSLLAGAAVAMTLASAPAMAETVAEILVRNPDLSTFVSAIEAAGLTEQIETAQTITVFAPTNEAFKALPPGVFDALQADKAKLKDVVLYHFVEGEVPSEKLKGSALSIAALNGKPLKDVIGDAAVVEADKRASNGVVHVIDTVLLTRE
ncbi:hypothetical protein CNY89_14495 [Amaricoccus sp. HAR-UPW-R2A-40]|jgi:uncharacterized surface protein with fasciclin (FAS1) repeats|nr:hypothetical protein CNY89_14495 [Amaricoccus sp. HAR-UPW-R2A-40]